MNRRVSMLWTVPLVVAAWLVCAMLLFCVVDVDTLDATQREIVFHIATLAAFGVMVVSLGAASVVRDIGRLVRWFLK